MRKIGGYGTSAITFAIGDSDKTMENLRFLDVMRMINGRYYRIIFYLFFIGILSSIGPKMIEDFAFHLVDRGLSHKSINNILSNLRVMISDAARLRLIQRNPFDAVRPLGVNSKKRGVLTIDEVKTLFDPYRIDQIWHGHLLYRTVNMLAASTGMRQGEILATCDIDLHGNYIHVAHSWGKYGLGPTKTGRERDVPIPRSVRSEMARFIGSGGYVFSFSGGKAPATGNRVTDFFYKSLERLGISKTERVSRNITWETVNLGG